MYKIIPTPWPFGQVVKINNIEYRFTGILWFYWESRGEWDYTYILENPDKKWTNTRLFSSKDFISFPYSLEIEKSLLEEKMIKEHGHPLTGAGHMVGIKWEDNKLFADFLITSRYFEHIYSECDKHGLYNGGTVIFPKTPSYNSREKQAKAVTAQYARENILKPELASVN